MRGRRTLRIAAPAVVLLVGLTAGCARDHGSAAPPAPAATPSGSAAAGQGSQQDMEKKVSDAESAAAAADRDAAQDNG
ncbi:hypothetical protein ACIHAA_14205 [Streptomyces sp. NPDC052040]|uniref:hypothetical protein n=1 Tax=unclassified Streptomyces TaxID=2593676 RepID=UPI0037D1A326